MRKLTSLILLCLAFLSTQAQMGKSPEEMIERFGKENLTQESEGQPGYKSLTFKIDSVRSLQATTKENKVVLMTYMHSDASIDEARCKEYLAENAPTYQPNLIAKLPVGTYFLDEANGIMVMYSHKVAGEFPLNGLFIFADPNIVEQMKEAFKTRWEEM